MVAVQLATGGAGFGLLTPAVAGLGTALLTWAATLMMGL
jgi:hypothetical protein